MTATKENRNRIIMVALAVVLILALAIGGTLAYLTDTDDATNTFTVGKVSIDLEEPNWDPENPPEDVVPNQEIAKDPQVKNDGNNDAVVFLKVTVPVKEVTLVQDNGTKGTKAAQEIFYMKQAEDDIATHANNFDANWVEIPEEETGTDYSGATRTYVFGYKTKVAKNATTAPLFDKVQLKNVIEGELDLSEQDIIIEAYAIQADEVIKDGAVINTDGDLSKDTLKNIYDIYFTQNPTTTTTTTAP